MDAGALRRWGEDGFAKSGRMNKSHGNWIKAATARHKGKFSAEAHRHHMSTQAYAKEHYHDKGTLGKEARLARTLAKLSKRKH